MLEEIWKDVEGFSRYQVSNKGRVRSSLVANSKLSQEDIQDIKYLKSIKTQHLDISEKYNICIQTVSNIVNGRHRADTSVYKYLKLNPTSQGFRYVILCNGKNKKSMRVHRLVAFAFLDIVDNKDQINHKDGTRDNNCLENLEWCNGSENSLHAYSIGLRQRGENHVNSKLTDDDVRNIRKLKLEGVKVSELASDYGVCRSVINLVIYNKRRFEHII